MINGINKKNNHEKLNTLFDNNVLDVTEDYDNIRHMYNYLDIPEKKLLTNMKSSYDYDYFNNEGGI